MALGAQPGQFLAGQRGGQDDEALTLEVGDLVRARPHAVTLTVTMPAAGLLG